MRDVILKALGELDPDNDGHWTVSGLPSMAALETRVGDASITREQITDIAPDFTRKHRVLPDGAPALNGDTPPADAAPTADGVDDADTHESSEQTIETEAPTALTFRVGTYFIGVNAPDSPPDTIAEKYRTRTADSSTDALPEGSRYALEEYGERQQVIGEAIKVLTEELRILGAEQEQFYPPDRTDTGYVHWQDDQAHYFATQEQLRTARETQVKALADADLPAALKHMMSARAAIDRAMVSKNTRGTQRPTVPLRGARG